MLHTVNKSPFSSDALNECARFASTGSDILLIEDGVYAAKAGSAYEPALKDVMKKCAVYALEADLKARGVTALVPGVKTVAYAGFVELVEKSKVHTWL